MFLLSRGSKNTLFLYEIKHLRPSGISLWRSPKLAAELSLLMIIGWTWQLGWLLRLSLGNHILTTCYHHRHINSISIATYSRLIFFFDQLSKISVIWIENWLRLFLCIPVDWHVNHIERVLKLHKAVKKNKPKHYNSITIMLANNNVCQHYCYWIIVLLFFCNIQDN